MARQAPISTSTRVNFFRRGVPPHSTCATYGNPEVLPITEATPTVPINPYGKAKLAAEVVVRDFAAANPVCALPHGAYCNT